jgi:hypothetical protein
LFARIVGVIVSPRATFEKLVGSPHVLGAIAIAGLVIGLSQGLPQFTESGKRAAIDAAAQQTERFTGRPLTDEQYAAVERQTPIRAIATICLTPVGVAVGVLIFSGLYYLAFNVVLGGTATFKQVASVSAHSSIIGALGAALGAPVQYIQGTMTPTGPFNLGALLPMLDENTFLARFLSYITVFSLWGTIVTAIGLAVLYRRKTANIAIGLLVLTVLIAAITATVVGFFTSGR